jgi:hypothetical protein
MDGECIGGDCELYNFYCFFFGAWTMIDFVRLLWFRHVESMFLGFGWHIGSRFRRYVKRERERILLRGCILGHVDLTYASRRLGFVCG